MSEIKAEDWKPIFRGLGHVTGEPDTGKTSLCLSVPGVMPEDVFFLDDDLKTRGLAASFAAAGHPFWQYVDLITQFKEFAASSHKTKPLDFYNFVNDKIQAAQTAIFKLERRQPKVLVFDNWSRMETAIRAYSETVMSSISDLTPGQQKNMSMMTWSYTYQEYSRFLGELMKIAPMVFITTHIKEKWGSPGVLEARGQRPLIENSTMRLWLRHNPAGPVPIGLVIKRLHRMDVVDGGIKPVNVLPRKISPCNWERIMWYMANPIGERQPERDEMPNAFELSILDGTLTDDQKNALKLAANQPARSEEEDFAPVEPVDEAKVTKAKELKAMGKSLPEIVKEIGEGATPGMVAKWLIA